MNNSSSKNNDIGRILIDSDEIAHRVQQMAGQLQADYASKDPVLIITLKGAMVFGADLIRNIDIPLSLDFVRASSYGDGTEASQNVRLNAATFDDLSGRHVLIIEDIIDTGRTLSALLEKLRNQQPASIKVCCLLDKTARRIADVQPDYVGFAIADHFVVGYGLDYAQQYRNLPYVAVLREDLYNQQ